MSALSSTKHEAIAALRRGEAVIFPTETVYGLGVSVEAAASPDVLYDLKERDRGKPISWLVGGVDDLDRYGAHVPDLARRLARAYWPGPLTLVVEAGGAVPAAFRSAAGSIGLRMPDNEAALELIEAVGCPLATTSANISGLQAPGAFDALDPDLAARVGVVVPDDGDDDKSGVASTVLDCTVDPPRLLREGAVSEPDIQALG
ncbi:L-threonylcarbamoyladenylate synthase [Eggerthella guodeyinii]|uniref:L-threonylcarbamoyladenylate synthase n=1 Tax=Eggerthella guodeyinii TaxID=2690837 RepID=A0A6N7RQG3_9ACTN|nr:L-threonylcarbamoyladenylate synthase [Eggerthella guodeyinii]MRX83444.1 threonylcarbamoyl-AMP synthase [Eggerthella guodeyinii]